MWFVVVILLFSFINGKDYLSFSQLNEHIRYQGNLLLRENVENVTFQSIPIGSSTEGRKLIAFCFGNCENSIPTYLIVGGIHGREGLSIMASLLFIQDVIGKLQKRDVETHLLLSTSKIWIIPCMNPDTYDMNVNMVKESLISSKHRIQQYGLFRKTMKVTCPEKNRKRRIDENGVDLNRNFPICFSIDEEGSSKNPCSDMYRGPFPFSENETQAFQWFLKSLQTKPSFALSLHSYGRSLLHPYSCKSLGLTLNQTIKLQFEIMTKEMLHNISSSYSSGQAWMIPDLYTVNGDIIDYLFHFFSIPGFNIELPPSYPQLNNQLGFWPSLQIHHNEVLQLLWNGWRISGCHLVLEDKSIQNRGYGDCKSVLITVNGSVVFTGAISKFERIKIASIEDKSSIRIEIKDWEIVLKWNEKLNTFQPERIENKVITHDESRSIDTRIEKTTIPSEAKIIPSQQQENDMTQSTILSDHFIIKLSASFPQQSYSQSFIILQLCIFVFVMVFLLFVLYC